MIFLRHVFRAVLVMTLAAQAQAQTTDTFLCLEGEVSTARQTVRAVGGQNADIERWPWQVRIEMPGYNEKRGEWGTGVCGGAILSDRWVISAAHCFHDLYVAVDYDRTPEIKLMVGVSDIRSAEAVHRVQEVFLHPEYDDASLANDIALLKLERSIVLNSRARAIRVATPSGLQKRGYPGACAITTGYGRIEDGGPLAGYLQEVDVPIVDAGRCRAALDEIYRQGGLWKGYAFRPEYICAGYERGGKDSCGGDSGGPLVVAGGPTHYTLAGVVSFGEGCALPGAFGVYTNVTFYLDWIQHTLAEN